METKRYAGQLKQWNVERGFGFIVSDDSGQDLFVHISSFPRDGKLPRLGETLTFEVEPDGTNRKRAVRVQRGGTVATARPRDHQTRSTRVSREPAKQSFVSRIVLALLIAALGFFSYRQYEVRTNALRETKVDTVINESPASVELFEPVAAPRSTSTQLMAEPRASGPLFRCDGRNMCSQMTSCDEAKLFLKNCSGMKIDGDHDGVPCEQQWC